MSLLTSRRLTSGSLTLVFPAPTRRITCALSLSPTTTVSSQRSMRRFDTSPRRAAPKGHDLHHPHSIESQRRPTPSPLLAHGTHQRNRDIAAMFGRQVPVPVITRPPGGVLARVASL